MRKWGFLLWDSIWNEPEKRREADFSDKYWFSAYSMKTTAHPGNFQVFFHSNKEWFKNKKNRQTVFFV